MNFFVDAKDSHTGAHTGALVMVVCRTKGEALAAVTKLRKEGYENVSVTDSAGSIVAESDLLNGSAGKPDGANSGL
jgi:rhodanese-related sulfurtransferase